MGHYSSFVVRIWVEEQKMLGNGYVQHVGTQESTYFTSLDKMTEFIMNHLSSSQNHLANPEDEVEIDSLQQDSEVKGGKNKHI